MWNIASFLRALFSLFGIFRSPEHDVIVVGGGAAGCSLAQTLAEGGGLKVLLLERGQEPSSLTQSVDTFGPSVRSNCAETILSESGHTLITGNCLGGATTINGAVWTEESIDWIQETFVDGTSESSFFDTPTITAAYSWLRERMAPDPSSESPGSYMETFTSDLAAAFAARTEFTIVDSNLDGQPDVPDEGVFRTHSGFDSNGRRRSADQLLNRESMDIIKGANVVKVTYQGDWFGTPLTVTGRATNPPTARCVRLDTMELYCVKVGGRIYLTAGALYTPVILMNSDIKGGGKKVDNAAVGKNLSDKVSARMTANLKKGLNFGGGAEFGNIAAMQKLSDRTIIYEQSTIDLEDSLWDLSAFERGAFPLAVRNTLLAELILRIGDSCNGQVINDVNFFGLRNPLCAGQFDLDEENCDQDIFGLSVYSTPPRSVGSVRRTLLGKPKVEMDFFENDSDYEALGIMFRTAIEVLDSLDVGQPPCGEDGGIPCPSCPDIIDENTGLIRLAHSILYALDSYDFPDVPPSTYLPSDIEPVMRSTTSNVEAGKKLRNNVNNGQHYCGTAAVGSVVDSKFKVKGADGLYIADASVVPRTSRGNLMAVVMLMGRLAGVSALEEMGQ